MATITEFQARLTGSPFVQGIDFSITRSFENVKGEKKLCYVCRDIHNICLFLRVITSGLYYAGSKYVSTHMPKLDRSILVGKMEGLLEL